MGDAFHRTLFPGTATVCGRELPPLTLWRLACLQAIASPFLSRDSKQRIDVPALLLALRAVATPNLEPPDLATRFRDRRDYWRYSRSQAKFEREAKTFVQWLCVHQLRPELWQNDDGDSGREITAPYILAQVASLMAAGMTHREAWDTSPGYADWLILAKGERESERIKFFSSEDEEINAQLAQAAPRTEAEIIAQAKADLPAKTFDRWLAARNKLNTTTK